MPRWLHALHTRLPRATLLWAGLCLLLTLGLLTTLADLTSLPGAELRAANSNGQRVIIDPVTGTVSGTAKPADSQPFEVSEGEEIDSAPDSESSESSSAEPTQEAEVPAEEPVAAPAGAPADAPTLRTDAQKVDLPQSASSHESIVAAPAPEITETGKQLLPKRGEKGSTASALYAKRFQRQESTSYITLLLTDVGFNDATLAQILKLPREVTVAVSPYALDPKPQITLLHMAGYETWGMLPAQSSRYPQDDPGPLGLVRGQGDKEQLKRLKQVMSSTLGAAGLVLPPDEAFTEGEEFPAILKEVDGRGLFLLSTHPGRSVAQLTKDAAIAEHIRRADLALDGTESTAQFTSKLAGLKELAREQGKLIVVATARPHTVELLAAWLEDAGLGSDVALAPLSAMYGPDKPPPPPEPVEEKKSSGGGH